MHAFGVHLSELHLQLSMLYGLQPTLEHLQKG